jgi:hypothetical protein
VAQLTPHYEAKPVPAKKSVLSGGFPYDPKVSLRQCPVGKSFSVDTAQCRRRIMDAAYVLKIKVRTKKNSVGGYDVWRLEEEK